MKVERVNAYKYKGRLFESEATMEDFKLEMALKEEFKIYCRRDSSMFFNDVYDWIKRSHIKKIIRKIIK